MKNQKLASISSIVIVLGYALYVLLSLTKQHPKTEPTFVIKESKPVDHVKVEQPCVSELSKYPHACDK